MNDRKLILITDYQGRFGTKYTAIPYRSGLDKEIVRNSFKRKGFSVQYITPAELANNKVHAGSGIILYTSSEDRSATYKYFIEDVLYNATLQGKIIIPSFHYLKAHNNKVFFEIFNKAHADRFRLLNTRVYGSYEELINDLGGIVYPVVVKSSAGFKSRGVFLADSENKLRKIARKVSRSMCYKDYLIDLLRTVKHPGFKPESQFRNKFVLQEFVPGLMNDYKVLIYNNRYYVLFRKTRKNDFRASGSGDFLFLREIPSGVLDFSRDLFSLFNVPQASFDIVTDGTNYFLLEAQFVYFGTYTIEKSEFWFTYGVSGEWVVNEGKSSLEEEYCSSMAVYIEKHMTGK